MTPTATQMPPNPLRSGEVLADRFRLLRSLGQGSIGTVWLAEDTQLENERVACKVLRAELRDQRDTLADLKRELLVTRKLRHPSILPLHMFWETPAAQFVTMEYVDGHSLSDALIDRRAPFGLAEVLPWLRDLAGALDYAHARGVLHRDVKPGNVLLSSSGEIYLADFGIARPTRDDRGANSAPGLAEGTIFFMSPEQLSGGTPDPRSDLYSLAASMYLLLAGVPPFHDGDIVSQIQVKPAPPIATLSEAVNRELLRALSKSPEKRHADCSEFHDALRSAADSSAAPLHHEGRRRSWSGNAPTVIIGAFGVETRRTRLGRLLVERGLLTQEQLAEALIEQHQSGGKLGAILIRQGRLGETALAEMLSEQLQTSTTRVTDAEIDPRVAHVWQRDAAEKHLALPLKRVPFGVLAAMVDPLDMEALHRLESAFGETIEPLVASETDLRAAIARVYSESRVR